MAIRAAKVALVAAVALFASRSQKPQHNDSFSWLQGWKT
jgi:hypothetical protein